VSTAHYLTELGAGLEGPTAPDSYTVSTVPSGLAY